MAINNWHVLASKASNATNASALPLAWNARKHSVMRALACGERSDDGSDLSEIIACHVMGGWRLHLLTMFSVDWEHSLQISVANIQVI